MYRVLKRQIIGLYNFILFLCGLCDLCGKKT
jgi:hypothetical protein